MHNTVSPQHTTLTLRKSSTHSCGSACWQWPQRQSFFLALGQTRELQDKHTHTPSRPTLSTRLEEGGIGKLPSILVVFDHGYFLTCSRGRKQLRTHTSPLGIIMKEKLHKEHANHWQASLLVDWFSCIIFIIIIIFSIQQRKESSGGHTDLFPSPQRVVVFVLFWSQKDFHLYAFMYSNVTNELSYLNIESGLIIDKIMFSVSIFIVYHHCFLIYNG